MSRVLKGRYTARIDGDFVVFLIGFRPSLRRPLRSIRDVGGRRGMSYMLKYLSEHPDKGLLGYEFGWPVIVQYWRSYEQLEAFARDRDDPHLEPWRAFWRRVGATDRTGIWHETFLVRAGEYESIYANMPPFGLGKATARSCRSPPTRRHADGSSGRSSDSPTARLSAGSATLGQPRRSPVSGWNACSSPVRTSTLSTSPMRGGTRPSKRTTYGRESALSPGSSP